MTKVDDNVRRQEIEGRLEEELAAAAVIYKAQVKALLAVAENQVDQRVVIYPHVRADGDAIGACFAFALILREVGFEVMILGEEPIEEKFKYILAMAPDMYQVATTPIETEQWQEWIKRQAVGVAIDSPARDRLGEREVLFEQAPIRFIIDHHPSDRPPEKYYVKRTSAGAACEMIADFLFYLEAAVDKILLNKEIATCLLTGLLTDTGRFSFTNTTSHTLKIASVTLQAGADMRTLTAHLFDTMSPGRMALIGLLAQRLTYHADGRIAMSYFIPEDFVRYHAVETDTDGLVGKLRDVEGVEISLLLQATKEGDLRGSLRSSDVFHVGRFAETLGGGGHQAAAGFTLEQTTLQDGQERLVKELTKRLTEQEASVPTATEATAAKRLVGAD
ncbi:MAG TPA: hypothetical protein GX717_00940 [Clostridiaceae bacterium]|nr:hypothetical protein [Clostridiaceae bacterium]